MSDPLRILIIDDSPEDALLMVRALESGGARIESQRVASATELAQALAARRWDIILSDYVMPSFNGLDALAISKKHPLEAPFLIVSGAIDDTQAVTAMRAGARDCIRKNDLARLLPAIERELNEVRHRRAL